MKINTWLVALGFMFFCVTSIFGQTPEEVFKHGNELFLGGKYPDAIKEYERIIKQHSASAELYFNLGNAYYRNEQLAQAILSYERAAKLRPNDPDIEHNLKLVYLKTIDRIEPVPEMFLIQWMRAIGSFVSVEMVRIVFIISWIILFGSLATMYLIYNSNIIRTTRYLFIISLLLVALGAVMMGIQSLLDTADDKAIITAQTVTAKSSPDIKSVDAFVIHEGVKVKLTDAVNSWIKIILADGKVGWIQIGQCERI